MANPEHLQILKQGVKAWNAWRKLNKGIRPDLSEADLHWVVLTEAHLKEAHLIDPNLCLDDIRKTDLFWANRIGANLSKANLSKTNLARVALAGANLTSANLTGADLSEANLIEANLSKTRLIDANLVGALLAEANLSEANLSGADLTSANLIEANLTEAHLSRTDLTEAVFPGANLTSANLTEAHLLRTVLIGANLTGADLSDAFLNETIFVDTDLTDVRGLMTCYHEGPSTLDHRTFARSRPLPLVFLRGCGLPDALINYLPSLLNEPFQFYSCFISYASKDDAFAKRLHERLQNAGLRIWFAPHDIQGGKKIYEQIDQAIRIYDKLLLVLSPHSIQSRWVESEIRRARKREVAEKRRLLFPIRLVDFEAIKAWECFDADIGKDLAAEIREYYIPDFTAWKDHDAFEAAVSRLLRDLKADEGGRQRTA